MTSAIRAVLVGLGGLTYAAAAAVLMGLALPMAGPGRAAWRPRARKGWHVVSHRVICAAFAATGLFVAGCTAVQVAKRYEEMPLPTPYLRYGATDSLRTGMSVEEVAHALGTRGVHQATAFEINGPQVLIVEVEIQDALGRRWLVFLDGNLAGMPKPNDNGVMPSEDIRAAGRVWAYAAEASDLLGVRVAPRPVPAESTLGHVMAVTSAIGYVQAKRDHEKNAAIALKFDGMKIRLGMRQGDVERLFGPPRSCEQFPGGVTAQYFGDDYDTALVYPHSHSWVAVLYQGEVVVGVYSRDFFSPAWKRRRGGCG